MNARVGLALFVAGAMACFIVAGCNKSSSPAPVPSPTSSSTFSPDTLWVQNATGRDVRSYKGASTANGGLFPNATLVTNDNARPDVVYDPATDTMWYPNQTVPTSAPQNSIDIWHTASADATPAAPTIQIISANTMNLEGAAVFDSLHNLLIVANNTNNTVDVYSMATAMTSASVPAGHVTLTMMDPGLVGTPRPQEMLYDPARDILFVSDNGTVCAKFNGFGTAAAGLSGGTTIVMPATTEITTLALGNSTGLAYNSTLDLLWVTEVSPPQVTIVKTASSWNTGANHAVNLTGFTQPSGLAYDSTTRDTLFVYDSGVVDVFPNGSTASGQQASWPGRKQIFDFTTSLSGFGLFVDTTH